MSASTNLPQGPKVLLDFTAKPSQEDIAFVTSSIRQASGIEVEARPHPSDIRVVFLPAKRSFGEDDNTEAMVALFKKWLREGEPITTYQCLLGDG